MIPLGTPIVPKPHVLSDGRVFLANRPIRNEAGLVIGWNYKEWKGILMQEASV